MLKALSQLFAPAPNPAPKAHAHQLHLATAVLLIEIGRADFALDERELEVVAEALQERFGLAAEELQALLQLAHETSQGSHSLHPYLRRINDHFSPEQKAEILQDLWRVALADGRLDKYEEYHIRRIADLLYLPHSVFIRSKHRVEDERAS